MQILNELKKEEKLLVPKFNGLQKDGHKVTYTTHSSMDVNWYYMSSNSWHIKNKL